MSSAVIPSDFFSSFLLLLLFFFPSASLRWLSLVALSAADIHISLYAPDSRIFSLINLTDKTPSNPFGQGIFDRTHRVPHFHPVQRYSIATPSLPPPPSKCVRVCINENPSSFNSDFAKPRLLEREREILDGISRGGLSV